MIDAGPIDWASREASELSMGMLYTAMSFESYCPNPALFVAFVGDIPLSHALLKGGLMHLQKV